MSFPKRTVTCGELRREHVGRWVRLNGWVARVRDLGGVIFVDVRDRYGITQVIVRPAEQPEIAQQVRQLTPESVIWVEGTVQERESPNPQLPTGLVEVRAEALGVLSLAEPLPFPLSEEGRVGEELRLRYRYLDLRRAQMQQNLLLRHRVYQVVHRYFDELGFVEVETPILARSTPEGARDFLVPCRLQPGKFYALPQSPQLFKQLLMVAGLDRYVQIAKCFRDEDLRADRQPEFTQVDVEMSFVEPDDVIAVTEGLFARLWREVLGRELSLPFPRLSYREAMERYGSDKPDLRYGLELVRLTELFADSGVKVLRSVVEHNGEVAAVVAPGCAGYTRAQLEELTELARRHGASGMLWLKYEGTGWSSPVLKHFREGELERLQQRLQLRQGDLALLVADQWERCYSALGALRREIARRLGLTRSQQDCFVWIVDFPLLEYSEEEGRFVARHHPFTAPRPQDIPLLESAPERVHAQAYDLVLNGEEIGGGSIRIHDLELQRRVFAVLGLSPQQVEEQFGFFLQAFRYGAPPHGGIALGLDRIVMLMVGAESIRDVIAFPKTTSGASLLDGAPAPVPQEQLRELGIALVPSEEEH